MIPGLWRLKEENQKLKVILGYKTLSLKKKKKKRRKHNNTVCILCCLLESTPPLKRERQSSHSHSEKVCDFPGPQSLPFHSLGDWLWLPAFPPLVALKRVLSGHLGQLQDPSVLATGTVWVVGKEISRFPLQPTSGWPSWHLGGEEGRIEAFSLFLLQSQIAKSWHLSALYGGW